MRTARNGHPTPERVEVPSKQLMGWAIRTTHEGKPLMRFFPDREFGGKGQALQACLRFAEQLGDRSEVGSLLQRLKPRKNNRSGVPGVARYEGGAQRGPYWLAFWEQDGRRTQRKFSVAVHGEDRARELALSARQEAVAADLRRLEMLRQKTARVLENETGSTPRRARLSDE